MPIRYHLITRAKFSVDRQRIWDALAEVGDWSTWWRWLDQVDVIAEGDEYGVGAVFRHVVTSPLRYGLTWETRLTRVDEPRLIELDASGELAGRGRCVLRDEADGSELTFTWLVSTAKRWMNLIGPVARTAFVWSHDRLMTDFARGIAGLTEADVDITHRSVRPGEEGFFLLADDVRSKEDERGDAD